MVTDSLYSKNVARIKVKKPAFFFFFSGDPAPPSVDHTGSLGFLGLVCSSLAGTSVSCTVSQSAGQFKAEKIRREPQLGPIFEPSPIQITL